MPDDGVVITLGDIYNSQQEMKVQLAEIGGALALQSQQDRNDKATLADHESRLRVLAQAQTGFITKAGAIAMVLAVAAVAGSSSAVLALVIR